MTSAAASPLFEEGNALFARGEFAAAAARYQEALARDPGSAEARFNLGCALDRSGAPVQALPHFREAARLRPEWADAHFNLGSVLARLGKGEEGLTHLQSAGRLNPHHPGIRNNLGLTLSALGRPAEAEGAFLEALRIDPHYAQAYSNLSALYERFGRTTEAISAATTALLVHPDFPEALNNLGNALKSQGRAAEALPHYREALRLRPDYPEAHSSLLFALNYPAGIAGEEIAAAHRAFGAVHRCTVPPHGNVPDPRRRLRIGYLSADFRDHAVSRFLEPVLKSHDRARFEVFCYSNVSAPDGRTGYLARCADHWREITRLSDAEGERLIREDGIDILVDLSGHTAGNRLPLFARKPAPVQVTWIGYPNTTGLDAIDYRITDGISDPPGLTERLHSEELLRLPGTFTCFAPPSGAPEASPLPAVGQGHLTFGSFNNPAKLTPETVALWCAVLRELPTSRMLVKGYSLADAETRERFAALFEREGISATRLTLTGNTESYAEHLALYRTVDIALDSTPYNGTTTTCEALWMGVPVVTLAGREHRSRVGATLLSAVGLPGLVAHTPAGFRDAALSLARDTGRLAELRRTLRATMAASPLMDGATFTRGLEGALRGVWEKWCSTRGAVAAHGTHPAGPPAAGKAEASGEGEPLASLAQTLHSLSRQGQVEALNRDIVDLGGTPLPSLAGEIASETLQRGAQVLVRRGLVTSADLICRELLDRGDRSAELWTTLGEIARELGEDAQAARYYQQGMERGDRSPGTAIALLKARESARVKGARPERRGHLLIKAWGYGFWSDMGHVLGGLLLAEITGRTPIVHWGGNSLFSDDPGRNAFETFFEPLGTGSAAELARTARSFFPHKWHAGNLLEDGVNVWEGAGSRLSALRVLERTEDVVVSDFHFCVHDLVPWIRPEHWLYGRDTDEVCRALFERHLVVRPEIRAEVEEFYRRRICGTTLLAVHARGGDKGGEDPNLERLNTLYAPCIDRFLASRPDGGIFLITDDETLLARFREGYGARVVHGDAVRTANGQGVHYQQGASRYRLGREVLIDVLLALRCHAFVGNGLSNVSCAVAQLKKWQPGTLRLLGARLDRMRPFTMYRS